MTTINIMAGGIFQSQEGWSAHPMKGMKAHYFTRSKFDEYDVVNSACGIETIEMAGIKLLNPGNFPRCKNCERAMKARTK